MTVFLDTNVFVYAVDPTDARKHASARRLLSNLRGRGAAVISTQVVGEFTAVLLGKLGRTHAREQALAQARSLAALWPVLGVDPRTVTWAHELCARYAISYWDAQVLATALLGECTAILTGDVLASELAGVSYANPFAAGFNLADLPGAS